MIIRRMRLPLYLVAAAALFAGNDSRADSGKENQADALLVALPATAYLLTWKYRDEPGAWALTRSLGLATLGTLALNAAIDKDAPNGSSGHAFPSGHTVIAFSAAAYIQRRYGWRPGLPAYLAASYTGYLRVATDDHDTGDVLGGMAVGILSSYLLTKPLGDNARVAAWSDGKGAGIQIQYRW